MVDKGIGRRRGTDKQMLRSHAWVFRAGGAGKGPGEWGRGVRGEGLVVEVGGRGETPRARRRYSALRD
jgi:hypothetical protein